MCFTRFKTEINTQTYAYLLPVVVDVQGFVCSFYVRPGLHNCFRSESIGKLVIVLP